MKLKPTQLLRLNAVRRGVLLIPLLMFGWICLQAQTVTGKIVDRASGDPLVGVTVMEDGTKNATVSDVDGMYSIRLTTGATAKLTYSYVGYEGVTVPYAGSNLMNVSLETGAALDEVVVTALGIERQTRTLTYAAQKIGGDQLNEVRDGNFANTLQGKAAGLQVTSSASGPGGAARVLLRGNRSLAKDNDALIVVDGVIYNNGKGGQVDNDFGGYNGSDGLSNINPDDIESVTVLKGASATALYGGTAANGALIITTKKGKSGKVKLDVNSGITVDMPMLTPNVQNEYGQGNGGQYNAAAAASWGPKMTGQSVTDWLGNSTPLNAQPDNIRDFFRNATSINNSFGISGGTDVVQTYFSYANNSIQGLVPNNDLKRNTLNLRISTKLGKRFSTDSKITYVNQAINNKVKSGEEGAIIMDLYLIPRNISITDAANNYQTTNDFGQPAHQYWTSSSLYMNPYWLANLTSVNERRNRILLLQSVNYKIAEGLNLMGRISVDKSIDNGSNTFYDGTLLWAQQGGHYDVWNTDNELRNFDLILSGDHQFGDNLSLEYLVGGTLLQNVSKGSSLSAAGLLIANKFNTGFARTLSGSDYDAQSEKQSVYAAVKVGMMNGIFLDLTARQDYSSNLPSPYSFFYPSAGLTFDFSELMTLPEFTDFLKLRLSYAVVGNDALPRILQQTYSFSQGGSNGFISRDATKAIPELKPELTNSLEVGLDWRMFHNRVGIDFTWYKTNTINQLMVLALPTATGFSAQYINAGNVANSGIELSLNIVPVKTDNFSWDMDFNVAKNTNEIIELDPNIKRTFVGGGYGRTAGMVIEEGGSYGDLYAFRWANKQLEDGTYTYEEGAGDYLTNSNGVPVSTSSQEYIGNFNPKMTLGWNNNFDFGKLTVGFLIDGRFGGTVVSGSEANLAFYGNASYTTNNRDGGWSLPGSSTPINAESFWTTVSGGRYSWGEFFAYDATNVRLRELSIGYRLPIHNDFIKGAKISLVGRNLTFLYMGKAILDIPGVGDRKLGFDPDITLGSSNWQGVEYGNLPATRSIGLNLKLEF